MKIFAPFLKPLFHNSEDNTILAYSKLDLIYEYIIKYQKAFKRQDLIIFNDKLIILKYDP